MIYCQKRKELIKPEAGQVWKAAYRSGRQFGDEYKIIHVSQHFGFCALKNRDGDYYTFSQKGKLRDGLGFVGFTVVLSELVDEAETPTLSWQPIDTAPKWEESEALLFSQNSGVCAGIIMSGTWHNVMHEPVEPSYWIPLPKAPSGFMDLSQYHSISPSNNSSEDKPHG